MTLTVNLVIDDDMLRCRPQIRGAAEPVPPIGNHPPDLERGDLDGLPRHRTSRCSQHWRMQMIRVIEHIGHKMQRLLHLDCVAGATETDAHGIGRITIGAESRAGDDANLLCAQM
jgi:hypothetical protein